MTELEEQLRPLTELAKDCTNPCISPTKSPKPNRAKRDSKVIDQMLGEAEPQVWISNCFSAQMKPTAKQRQLCPAHQLRDLQYGIDA